MDDRSSRIITRKDKPFLYTRIYVSKRVQIFCLFFSAKDMFKAYYLVAYGSIWGQVPYPGLHVHLHHLPERKLALLFFPLCKASVIVATLFNSSSSKHSGGWRKNLTDILWVYHFVYLLSSWCVSILTYLSTYAFPKCPYVNNADPLHNTIGRN